jgi:protein-tyrosine phosphatase
VRILFVCLGNICRSPSAEAVMRDAVRQAGLTERVSVDSAGTGSWHVGHPPDSRAREAARARGIEVEGVARQVTDEDFQRFDLIVAMDASNRDELHRMAPDEAGRAKVRMLREFEGSAGHGDPPGLDVPDPYYGGPRGFDQVLDLLEASCAGLLQEVRDRLDGDAPTDLGTNAEAGAPGEQTAPRAGLPEA